MTWLRRPRRQVSGHYAETEGHVRLIVLRYPGIPVEEGMDKYLHSLF